MSTHEEEKKETAAGSVTSADVDLAATLRESSRAFVSELASLKEELHAVRSSVAPRAQPGTPAQGAKRSLRTASTPYGGREAAGGGGGGAAAAPRSLRTPSRAYGGGEDDGASAAGLDEAVRAQAVASIAREVGSLKSELDSLRAEMVNVMSSMSQIPAMAAQAMQQQMEQQQALAARAASPASAASSSPTRPSAALDDVRASMSPDERAEFDAERARAAAERKKRTEEAFRREEAALLREAGLDEALAAGVAGRKASSPGGKRSAVAAQFSEAELAKMRAKEERLARVIERHRSAAPAQLADDRNLDEYLKRGGMPPRSPTAARVQLGIFLIFALLFVFVFYPWMQDRVKHLQDPASHPELLDRAAARAANAAASASDDL